MFFFIRKSMFLSSMSETVQDKVQVAIRNMDGSRTIRTLDYLYRPWTFRTLDDSYLGLFVPSLDDSYHVEN